MATIGYGDITPITVNEKIFVTFCMLLACGVFSYIIGYLGSIFDKSETIIADFKTKSLHIKQFLVFHSLPKTFRNQVIRYLDYLVVSQMHQLIKSKSLCCLLFFIRTINGSSSLKKRKCLTC